MNYSKLVTKKLFSAATDNIKLWLLQTYVKKMGYYAIELYSGTLVLDEIAFAHHITQYSQQDLQQIDSTTTTTEPLRVLVLGQVKSGKSSLINALFGEVKAQTDKLPHTCTLIPYLLKRENTEQVIIFDSVGYEDRQDPRQLFMQMEAEVLRCDFILLVCTALHAARQPDKLILGALDTLFQKQADMPMVVPQTQSE